MLLLNRNNNTNTVGYPCTVNDRVEASCEKSERTRGTERLNCVRKKVLALHLKYKKGPDKRVPLLVPLCVNGF
jgi:hypothetical protein